MVRIPTGPSQVSTQTIELSHDGSIGVIVEVTEFGLSEKLIDERCAGGVFFGGMRVMVGLE